MRRPHLRRMRRKLGSPARRETYVRRKAEVEPVFGVRYAAVQNERHG